MGKKISEIPLTKKQQKIVTQNLKWGYKLAVQVANKIGASFELREDLIQQSLAGLMRASKDWDPEKGAFTTHSWWWCRAYMWKVIAANGSHAFGVPKSYIKSESYIKRGQAAKKYVFSLDEPIAGDIDSKHEIIADELSRNIEKRFLVLEEFNELKNILTKAAKRLKSSRVSKVALSIINQRLFAETPISNKELSMKLGISRQRIEQVQKMLFTEASFDVERKLGRPLNWNGRLFN